MASLFCAFRFPSPPFSYSANLSHSNGTFPPMAVSMTRQGARKLSSSSSISVFSLSLPKLHSQIQTPTTPFTIVAAKGYKMKTHKASSKRFRVTGKGKIVRRRAGKQHLLAKKTNKRKLRLSKMVTVNRSDYNNVIGALPYLKVNRKAT
ncbi:hypothetical protein ZOSMA_50G00160 [Zostera marina]|uniref:50S ribosomal protein L35 n=1 Tax=Zostera marina TaxID=29655 RepID=A0A0K9P066_ZOSMR|nr:hypothetical protein ZOSMA_50G00160 [Zostera marina]